MNPKVLLAAAAVALSGIVGWLLLTPPGDTGQGAATSATGGSDTVAALTAEGIQPGGRPGEMPLAPESSTPKERRSAVKAAPSAGGGALSEAGLALLDGPTVSGRVLSDMGLPVVGAEVKFERPIDRNLVNLLSGGGGGPAITDENGRFELSGSAGEEVTLVVGADGFTELREEDYLLPEDTDIPLEDVVLLPSLWLWGQVTNPAGQPLVGATLERVDSDRSPWQPQWSNDDPDGITDERGEFQLPREDVGPWEFKVKYEGYLTATFEGEGKQAGRSQVPLEFKLLPGKSVSGKVLDVPDELLETTVVRALPEGEVVFRRLTSDLSGVSDVAQDGSFEIGGLDPEREYKIVASATNIGPGSMFSGGGERSEPEFLFPGDQEIELNYRAGTEILFQVIDANSKEPVENFRARFGQPFASKDLLDSTGEPRQHFEKGRGRFDDLHEDDKMPWGDNLPSLEIQASGYMRYINDEIELSPGEVVDLGTIMLEPVPMITVRVVDQRRGKALKNARVSVRPMENGLMPFLGNNESLLGSRGFTTKTDEEGRAEVTSLGSVAGRLEIDKGGYAPYIQENFIAGATGSELDIALSKGGEVVVLVRDASGQPVPDVNVYHSRPHQEGRDGGAEQSSSKGRVRYRRLEPGEHRFRLARSWQAVEPDEEEEGWQSVRVSDGSEVELVLPAKSLGRVSGRVFLGGRPLANAEVDLTEIEKDSEENWDWGRGQNSDTSDETNADGSYEVKNLRYGDYMANVKHPSLSLAYPVEVEVRASQVNLEIQIPITGLRGRVVDHRGRPVPGVALSVYSSRSSSDELAAERFRRRFLNMSDNDSTMSGDDGVFEFPGLPADNEVRVRVDSDLWYGPTSEAVEIGEGDFTDGLEVRVVEAASLRVEVEMPVSDNWNYVQVRAIPEELELPDGFPEPGEQQDGSWGGQDAELAGLPPGRWKIIGSYTPNNFNDDEVEPEEVVREQIINLSAGEHATLELSFL